MAQVLRSGKSFGVGSFGVRQLAYDCCTNRCSASVLALYCKDEVKDGTWCEFIRDATTYFPDLTN
ncbi:unnamed protein product [Diabrotica balteata]|uniref:Uncharacterized protein n=1 Tax=Diabrotica balteata TaxID=107213 RepID=A0A9N9X916_DIABA|nr:unnamed protein product [Diabrotica balteata]